jgi:hypothetical protein
MAEPPGHSCIHHQKFHFLFIYLARASAEKQLEAGCQKQLRSGLECIHDFENIKSSVNPLQCLNYVNGKSPVDIPSSNF